MKHAVIRAHSRHEVQIIIAEPAGQGWSHFVQASDLVDPQRPPSIPRLPPRPKSLDLDNSTRQRKLDLHSHPCKSCVIAQGITRYFSECSPARTEGEADANSMSRELLGIVRDAERQDCKSLHPGSIPGRASRCRDQMSGRGLSPRPASLRARRRASVASGAGGCPGRSPSARTGCWRCPTSCRPNATTRNSVGP